MTEIVTQFIQLRDTNMFIKAKSFVTMFPVFSNIEPDSIELA